MGNSFKLQQGGPAKSQARSAGVLLMCLAIVVYLLVWDVAGYVMFAAGAILLLASFAASE